MRNRSTYAAALVEDGADLTEVSRADVVRERAWRLQAEARAAAAEERAAAAEDRAVVAEWLVARLRGELVGDEQGWGRRRWWPWRRRDVSAEWWERVVGERL